jgi:hypothetical protein
MNCALHLSREGRREVSAQKRTLRVWYVAVERLMRSSVRSARPLVDRQGLVLTAVARVRVDRACLLVLIAGRLGQMLSLDGLPLCGGMSLSRLGSAFLGFGLSAFGFGGLLIG